MSLDNWKGCPGSVKDIGRGNLKKLTLIPGQKAAKKIDFKKTRRQFNASDFNVLWNFGVYVLLRQ